MQRSVPLWAVALCFILWLILTVSFGWLVRSRAHGSDRGGVLGEWALEIAGFPTLVKDVVLELSGRATGDNVDVSFRIKREKGLDLTGFAPVTTKADISLPGLLIKANGAAEPGWRLITGAFADPAGVENMALLMAPDYRILGRVILDEIPLGDQVPRDASRKFVHGLEVLADGSFIFTFDGSMSLQRFDLCGKRLWAIPGTYSHAVVADDAGSSVWSIKSGDRLMQIAVADGKVEREITIQAIIDANPGIDILEIMRAHDNDIGENSRNTKGYWLPDNLHLNDVEPLPTALANRFPEFAAGDLLVSARSLNLVFVLDPGTLRIKWWVFGLTERQHDPDWLPTGEIMVYNNRMSRDYSEIVAITPATMARRTVYDGRNHDFYSRIRGKAQLLPSGALEITSPQQGRAFEVAQDGGIAFEIVNTPPDNDAVNYAISEMRWLPQDFFRPGAACVPAAP